MANVILLAVLVVVLMLALPSVVASGVGAILLKRDRVAGARRRRPH